MRAHMCGFAALARAFGALASTSLGASRQGELQQRAVRAAAAPRRQQQKSAASGGGRRQSSGGGAFDAAADAAAVAAPLANRGLLAEKLTQTARNIEWIDPPGSRPVEASRADVDALQQRLNYTFKNRYLLRLALIHSSAAPTTHNGIMAWIGDAALYLVVAEEVAAALGYVPIGKLSEVRKTLIGRLMCERYANHLALGPHLVLGKSVRVQQAGEPSSNMLAEMFEAVMGAIYLDGDLEAVRRCYMQHFPLPADPLSLLQPDGTGGLPRPAADGGSAEPPGAWD